MVGLTDQLSPRFIRGLIFSGLAGRLRHGRQGRASVAVPVKGSGCLSAESGLIQNRLDNGAEAETNVFAWFGKGGVNAPAVRSGRVGGNLKPRNNLFRRCSERNRRFPAAPAPSKFRMTRFRRLGWSAKRLCLCNPVFAVSRAFPDGGRKAVGERRPESGGGRPKPGGLTPISGSGTGAPVLVCGKDAVFHSFGAHMTRASAVFIANSLWGRAAHTARAAVRNRP